MGSFPCDILFNLVGKLVGLAFNQLQKNISYLLGEHNQIPHIHLRYLCNLEGLDQIVKNMTSLLANAIRLHTINRSPRNSKSVRHGLHLCVAGSIPGSDICVEGVCVRSPPRFGRWFLRALRFPTNLNKSDCYISSLLSLPSFFNGSTLTPVVNDPSGCRTAVTSSNKTNKQNHPLTRL